MYVNIRKNDKSGTRLTFQSKDLVTLLDIIIDGLAFDRHKWKKKKEKERGKRWRVYGREAENEPKRGM